MRDYNEITEDERTIFDTAVQDAISEGLIPASTPRDLWCDKHCCRCGAVVFKEPEPGIDYPYYCPVCDENMYSFEVE